MSRALLDGLYLDVAVAHGGNLVTVGGRIDPTTVTGATPDQLIVL